VEEGEGEDLFIRGSHSPEWSLAFPCRAQAKKITHGQCCQLLAKFSWQFARKIRLLGNQSLPFANFLTANNLSDKNDFLPLVNMKVYIA
jgi:hypothetical protein